MGAVRVRQLGMAFVLIGALPAAGSAQVPVIDADFAKGDFPALGW